MKRKLRDTDVKGLPAKASSYEVRDTLTRGLVLRVGVKGAKVWEVVVSDGKTLEGRPRRKRIRLGQHPAMPVKAARKAAEAAKEDAFRPTGFGEVVTVADLFERYESKRAGEMRSWSDVESVWRNWGHAKLGHIRLTDLSIFHGLDFRDHIASNSSPLRAAATIRYLRPMFAWAADEGVLAANPWAGLKVGATAQARDRVLNEDEWVEIWRAALELEYPFGPWVQALMLSAQRLSNVAQAEWTEIHGDVWVIPREKMKATRPDKAKAHEVPLSPALAELFAAQPRRGPFVFTTTGDKAITPGSKLKTKIERAAGVTNWRWHDIRRTGMTMMTSGGVSRFIAARVLGHADQSVTGIYDRSSYREEKRAALTQLSSTLGIAVDPQTGVRLL